MQEPLPDGGTIRKLWIGETDAYRDHLLRLDRESRYRRFSGTLADEVIARQRAGKAPVAAFAVEAEQVVAIDVGLADPQFADGSAVGQRLLHFGSPRRRPLRLSESSVPTYMVQCSKKTT